MNNITPYGVLHSSILFAIIISALMGLNTELSVIIHHTSLMLNGLLVVPQNLQYTLMHSVSLSLH